MANKKRLGKHPATHGRGSGSKAPPYFEMRLELFKVWRFLSVLMVPFVSFIQLWHLTSSNIALEEYLAEQDQALQQDLIAVINSQSISTAAHRYSTPTLVFEDR